MNMTELALAYASAGIPVFPCHERDTEFVREDGSTGVKSEKSPILTNGLHSATLSERLIKRRWEDNPAAIVGAPTGAAANFWVLDIDVPSDKHKSDGRKWLDEMEIKHGRLPATKIGQTANGGYHFLFRHVDGIRNGAGIGPGVDVRGEGGFIVMPGSVMADGRFYEWVDGTDGHEIADAPQWLVDAVINRSKEFEGAYVPTADYVAGKNKPYVDAGVEKECENVRMAGEGERGFTLNKSAFSLGTMVAAGDLDRSEAISALFNAANASGLVQKDGAKSVMATIERGLKASADRPRAAPAAKVRSNTSLRDMDRMLGRLKVASEADAAQRRAEVEAAGGVWDEEDEAHHDEDYETQLSDTRGMDILGDEGEYKRIRASAFSLNDPKPPTRKFVYGKHFIRQFVSMTVSPGGIGKTSASLVEAVAMASGRNLLGVEVDRPLKVWVFNAEDPLEEMQRRMHAICRYFDIQQHEIEGRIFIDSGRNQDLVIAHEMDRQTRFIEPVVASVHDELVDRGIDVMIIDPFVSTHMVNENDNGAIDKVAKMWGKIAHMANCSIDIVHHMKKVDGREASIDDVRGASSLIGAARSVRLYSRMTEEQAEQAGIDAEERHGYFSITNGKANLAPISSKLEWRKLVGETVGNGTSRLDPSDDAPVVTRWRFPSLMDHAVKLSGEEINQLKGLYMAGGGWLPKATKDKKAMTASRALGVVLKLAPGDDDNKIKATMFAMERDGYFAEDRETDQVSQQITAVYRWKR